MPWGRVLRTSSVSRPRPRRCTWTSAEILCRECISSHDLQHLVQAGQANLPAGWQQWPATPAPLQVHRDRPLGLFARHGPVLYGAPTGPCDNLHGGAGENSSGLLAQSHGRGGAEVGRITAPGGRGGCAESCRRAAGLVESRIARRPKRPGRAAPRFGQACLAVGQLRHAGDARHAHVLCRTSRLGRAGRAPRRSRDATERAPRPAAGGAARGA
jgi:hypothetical protein